MISLDFAACEDLYKGDAIQDLGNHPSGMRYLLLRSLSRKEQMVRLASDWHVDISDLRARDMLRSLYESHVTNDEIRHTIRSIYADGRNERALYEPQLIAELYKVTTFDWGGLHQNSLDKAIVDNYVKKIRSFDIINEKIDQELFASMRGYTQCSWYNHWTSILIEDIFKQHPSVLPTVGLIKKVDFFVNDVPFDLKVTHFPEGYIKEMRKMHGLRSEITELKKEARRLKITFDNTLHEIKLREHLWSMIADQPSPDSKSLISDLRSFRSQLLTEAVSNPCGLIVWLYENQGTRRFDASNRLFLVLVDSQDYFSSWKLKRAHSLLVHNINAYLDNVNNRSMHKINFTNDSTSYSAHADVLFVVRN